MFCDGMTLIGEIIGFTTAVDNDGKYASMDFFCDNFSGDIVRAYENEINNILLLNDLKNEGKIWKLRK